MSATTHQAFTTSTLPGVSPLEPAETHQESSLAAARLVGPEAYELVMSRSFGPRTWFHAESLIRGVLHHRCTNSTAVVWRLYQSDDGCGYLAPESNAPLELRNGLGATVSLSADAAGLVASLLGLAILWSRVPDNAAKELLQDRYADLREFAIQHREASAIARALAST